VRKDFFLLYLEGGRAGREFALFARPLESRRIMAATDTVEPTSLLCGTGNHHNTSAGLKGRSRCGAVAAARRRDSRVRRLIPGAKSTGKQLNPKDS